MLGKARWLERLGMVVGGSTLLGGAGAELTAQPLHGPHAGNNASIACQCIATVASVGGMRGVCAPGAGAPSLQAATGGYPPDIFEHGDEQVRVHGWSLGPSVLEQCSVHAEGGH